MHSCAIAGQCAIHLPPLPRPSLQHPPALRQLRSPASQPAAAAVSGVVGAMGPIDQMAAADFQRTLDINLLGVFHGIKHAARAMKARVAGEAGNDGG